jgi:hypothetical protein
MLNGVVALGGLNRSMQHWLAEDRDKPKWVFPMRGIFVLFFLTAASACAQQPAPYTAPAFETASIRHAKLTNGCFSMLPPAAPSML